MEVKQAKTSAIMQTNLCKTDKEEILRQVVVIWDALVQYSGNTPVMAVEESAAYKKIESILNQPYHPSGDQSLLSNQSIYSWERLISMRDEVDNINDKRFDPVFNTIQAEIERRLLALLPQEK